MLNELDSWSSAAVLFVAQLALNWIRALNIRHITKKRLGKGLISVNALNVTYLVTTALGVRSVFEGDLIPLLGYFGGASVGYFIAVRASGTWGD